MSYKLNAKILQDLAAEHEELVALLKTMCKITAPSNHEEKRAEFCKQWLEDMGAQGVYIDDALTLFIPLIVKAINLLIFFLPILILCFLIQNLCLCGKKMASFIVPV